MIDLIEIQKLIYDRLSQCSYTLVDEFTTYQEAIPPYCQMGDLYITEDSTKVEEGLEVEQYVNLYSNYRGKKQILEMIQEVNKVMNFKTIITNEEVTYSVYVTTERSTIMLDTDRNGNQFYHAVLIFIIHIN